MSAAGCIDRVEIHGVAYEVQTELVDPVRGRVRTLIFHSGRIVAVNQGWLRSSAALASDPDTVQELVVLHHRQVIDGFVGRTRSFVERVRTGQLRPAELPPPPPSLLPPPVEATPEMPPFPEDPALTDGLDLRRLFGELRRRIDGRSPDEAERETPHDESADRASELRRRLERVGRALTWAIEQPRFTRARVDEQACFHLLSQRIESWAKCGQNPEEAEWIWTEVLLFCDYVSEISHRSELVDFDRQLVLWGFRTLERHGTTRSTLKPLEWLFGRDPELDELLTTRQTVEAEVLAEHLRRVWCRLGTG